jgi:hypothetical protein
MENKDSTVTYYPSGQISERYWYDNGVLHSENDKPAYKGYFGSGKLSTENWYRKGELHRIDGPATINYSLSGHLFETVWFYFGYMHNENGPACTKYGRYYTDDDATTHRKEVCKWYLMGEHIGESGHAELVSFGQNIMSDRNLAIMNIKHESLYIRLICKAVIRELS